MTPTLHSRRDMPRILMIEDSEDDAALVGLALAGAGWGAELSRASSRAELEARLAQRPWDAILCDHHLPGFDSLSALDLVRRTDEATPFIILSGAIPDDVAIEAMRRGARDFVRKDQMSRLVLVLERELRTADMVRELDRLSSDIGRLADFDRLTGLPNREHLLRYLSLLNRSRDAHPGAIGLLLADVGRFRKVGHGLDAPLVDGVIVEMARRIAQAARPADFVARVGGDSFAIVVHDAGEAALEHLARELMRLARQPLSAGGIELFLHLNIGAARFPDGAADSLFTCAEAALFQAKKAGGGSYRYFEPQMAVADRRTIALESALHRALANREFILHYQPQVELRNGSLVSAEALLRWRHPVLGLVPPLEFIPLLERTGLIVPVGAWIVDAACAQLRAWQDAGLPPIRVAVNLSALQFEDAGLTGVVADALRRHRLEPGRLELEITESIVMEGKDEAIAALQSLRALGVRIAVDDFGTGYSSLGYLKRFPITTLKIDQLFVRGCDESVQDQALTETMIAMGHRLGLEIVAEGVESERHARFLAERKCELAQGFYFGEAVPADEVAERLAPAAVRRRQAAG